MDYKSKKLIQIIKEFLGNNKNKFEINGIDLSRAVFFYRENNKKFVPIPKGNYRVQTENNNTYLNIDDVIKNKAYEYQICYEDKQISSFYLEDFPELNILVKKYNDVVNDIRNIIQLLNTVGMKSDTSQMTQILTKLQINTFWYLNENGELDAFPIGDLNSKYQDMLKNMKNNVEQTLNSVHQALKSDLENLVKNYNITVEQAKKDIENKKNSSKEELKDLISNHNNVVNDTKQEIENLKTTTETSIRDKKNEAINALNTLKTDLENQLSSLKNSLSENLNNNLNSHLQSLESAVNRYITSNRDRLKGEKGDKGDSITSIQQTNETSIEVKYGNKKSVVTIPRANSITDLIYENDILKINLSDGTNRQVQIQSGSKLKKLFEVEYTNFHATPSYLVVNLPKPLLEYKKIALTVAFMEPRNYTYPTLEINLSDEIFDGETLNRIKNNPAYTSGNGKKIFISIKNIRNSSQEYNNFSAFIYDYDIATNFFVSSENISEIMKKNNIMFGFLGNSINHVFGRYVTISGLSKLIVWGEEK